MSEHFNDFFPELSEDEQLNMCDEFHEFEEFDENEFELFDELEAEKYAASIANDDFCNGRLRIADGISYSLDDMTTKLNNNVLVVGGSGTGKTRTIVTPNLHEAVGSYIISDPKGNLSKRYGNYLRKKGYTIQTVDFTHPEKSAHYNPLSNIRTTQDILKISSVIVNEQASVGTKADPYWDSMSIMLVSAIIAYMLESDYQPCNFSSIMKLVREGERDDDESKKSELSARFKKHKLLRNPSSWACAQFESVNQAPQKTYDCIRSSLSAKFANFDTEELQIMMSGNDFDFSSVGRKKTALFVTVSDTDRTMDGLVNIFFTQAMQSLCDYADNQCYDNRLPVPVRFILDDFATNCRIDEFPRMISSIRSRGISVMLMIQSEAQLTQGYGYDDSTIISNCDTYVYLGGNDVSTAQSISVRCNKPLGHVLNMPVGSCWVFRRGSQPVYAKLNDVKECISEMEL